MRLLFSQYFKLSDMVQIVVIFCIIMLVVHSHVGADFSMETLRKLRQEESLGLLQLQKIERHSLTLHENVRKRLQGTGVLAEDEIDPLEPQHRQLEKMTSEIENQVVSLQKRIQTAARKQIIQAYGEGPVKVVIELDFGDSGNAPFDEVSDASTSSQISIAMLPETPSSVWTVLEQVGRNIWDGAGLQWDTSSNVLLIRPAETDTSAKSRRLEFVEHHPSDPRTNPGFHHGPWTVGLRESMEENIEDDEIIGNSLELFVNLADNREAFKHETCIGKILDGFYALQRLLEATSVKEGNAITNVKVKTITAMHITNHELNQIF